MDRPDNAVKYRFGWGVVADKRYWATHTPMGETMADTKKKGPTGLWAALENFLVGNIEDPKYDPISDIKAELIKAGVPEKIARPITKKIVEGKAGELGDSALDRVSSPQFQTPMKNETPVSKAPSKSFKTPHIVGR